MTLTGASLVEISAVGLGGVIVGILLVYAIHWLDRRNGRHDK